MALVRVHVCCLAKLSKAKQLERREYNANTSEQEGMTLDAIIERYRARIGGSGLVLTHPSGIKFDLAADEALELLHFLKVYTRTFITTERETNPELERIVIKEHEDYRTWLSFYYSEHP